MDDLKRIRVEVIKTLLKQGWRPPRPETHQTDRILADMERLRSHQTLGLTDLEADVLNRIAAGYTAVEIGHATHRSTETIRSYKKSILRKLGACNSAHAVAIALHEELLEPKKAA